VEPLREGFSGLVRRGIRRTRVGRERVRQLEASALQQLAGAAAHDRYRPLRWRAASAAQPDRVHAAVIPGAPPWVCNMLSWLAGTPA
jgi:hypothetical protein